MRQLSLALTIVVALFGSMTAKANPIVGGQVDVIAHSVNQFFLAGFQIGFIPPAAPPAPPPPPLVNFPIIGGDTSTGTVILDGGVTFFDAANTLNTLPFWGDDYGGYLH